MLSPEDMQTAISRASTRKVIFHFRPLKNQIKRKIGCLIMSFDKSCKLHLKCAHFCLGWNVQQSTTKVILFAKFNGKRNNAAVLVNDQIQVKKTKTTIVVSNGRYTFYQIHFIKHIVSNTIYLILCTKYHLSNTMYGWC